MKSLTLSDFHKQLNLSDFGQKYIQLAQDIQNENRGLKREKGFERHHIHPRALGGADLKENIIKVSIYEHCLLHALLAKAFPCTETFYPIRRISSSQYVNLEDVEKIDLEDVCAWSQLREEALHFPIPQEVRDKISKATKGKIKPNLQGKPKSEEHKQHLSQANLGKKLSQETIQKIQKTRKENYKKKVLVYRESIQKIIPLIELEKYLEEGWVRGRCPSSVEKMRKTITGRTLTEDQKLTISKALKGKPSKLRGRKQSKEHVQKRAEALKGRVGHPVSEETRKKMSESHKGKSAWNKGITWKTKKYRKVQEI